MNISVIKLLINTVKFVVFLVVTWILIHVLALMGIFLGLAYPIWGLILPKLLVCVGCQTHPVGNRCLVCKRITGSNNSYFTFRGLVLNGIFIVILSICCLGIVFLEKYMIQSVLHIVPKTVVLETPGSKTIYVDAYTPLRFILSDIKTSVNAVQIDLEYDPETLEVIDFITKDSFASIFIEKSIDNERGFSRVSGGVPNPGFLSETGLFGTVVFKAKKPGPIIIRILPSSLVLANDGYGTNILSRYSDVSYLALPQTEAQALDTGDKQLNWEALVLGAKDDRQIIFFDQDTPSVFGAETETNNEAKQNTLWDNFVLFMKWIDDIIINFWRGLLALNPW